MKNLYVLCVVGILYLFCVSDGNAMAVKVSLLELVLTVMCAMTSISAWDVTLQTHGHLSKCLSYGSYLFLKYYLRWTITFEIFFQAVQTQTTTVYCRILPTLDHYV